MTKNVVLVDPVELVGRANVLGENVDGIVMISSLRVTKVRSQKGPMTVLQYNSVREMEYLI